MGSQQALQLPTPAPTRAHFQGRAVGSYKTLLADPPWPERGAGQIKRGADRHYGLMSIDQILALPVEDLADPAGAHLYLWVTNNYLLDGLHVLSTWGFSYVTTITWAKDRIGLGQYFRGQTEHVLFGTRGTVPYKLTPDGGRIQGRTLIHAPRGRHSEKPPELRATAELVSHEPRVELFARCKAAGWDAWGNEVESDLVYVPEPERTAAQLAIGAVAYG